jgi:hypothetical protein
VINWLTASRTSVQLGCSKQTKSAKITLRNYGPEETVWSANYNWFGGVSVSPLWGTLSSQGVAPVTITNDTSTLFGGGQHGTITIKPANAHAGASVVINYVTQAC